MNITGLVPDVMNLIVIGIKKGKDIVNGKTRQVCKDRESITR